LRKEHWPEVSPDDFPRPPFICFVRLDLFEILCRQQNRKTLRLPLHLVGLVAGPQAEGAGEVAGEEVDLLDAGDQGLVDGLLVSSTVAVDLLLLETHIRQYSVLRSLPDFMANRTWGFSPCLKKASSPAFCWALSAVKYLGWETSSTFFWSRPETSTL
jgi:hypothetical protein